MTAYIVAIVLLSAQVLVLAALLLRQRYVYARRVVRLTLRLHRERQAYARLITRYMRVCKTTRDRAARATADEPIPFEVVERPLSPYLPDFTPGLPEDVDEQFDDLMHRTFITDESESR